MSRSALKAFKDKHYHAGNLIVSVAGNVDPEKILKDIEKATAPLPAGPKSTFKKAVYKGGVHHVERNTAQLNLVMTFNGVARNDARTPAAQMLGVILGGGMSSRLFQEIRGKRGLVYSIGAGNSAALDTGTFSIYAGTGPEQIKTLLPVLCDELKKVCQNGVTEQELERAKSQVKVSAARQDESMQSRMLRPAQALQYNGRLMTLEESVEKLDAVTVEDVKKVANEIFSSKPTLSTVGPGANIESYKKICSRLKL
jgi:predicted Zn-dependent peptidase